MKELGAKNITMPDSILTYTNTTGIKTIRIAEKKRQKKNYMTLTDTNGVYQFDLTVAKQSRPSTPDMRVSIAKNIIFMKIIDKDLSLSISTGKIICSI
jgi:hypothetical protein